MICNSSASAEVYVRQRDTQILVTCCRIPIPDAIWEPFLLFYRTFSSVATVSRLQSPFRTWNLPSVFTAIRLLPGYKSRAFSSTPSTWRVSYEFSTRANHLWQAREISIENEQSINFRSKLLPNSDSIRQNSKFNSTFARYSLTLARGKEKFETIV